MAQDARDYVAQLYQQELGRSGANDPGMQAWADAIASGAMSREAVAQAIGRSEEGARYDVGQAYRQELGRAADDPGAQNWVQAIQSGAMTAEEARNAIGRSQEGAQYDVARLYTAQDGLRRQGTLADIYAKDPAAKQWEQALMSGQITEQQFVDAVRQSQEYKALQGTTTGTPNADLIKQLQDTILKNQQAWEAERKALEERLLAGTQGTKAMEFQKDAFASIAANNAQNQAALQAAYNRQLQPLQQSLLSTNATENATRGFFSPGMSAPLPTPTAGATTPTPATAAPITPAPGYFVPQTYLAPPPPQYRTIDPFAPGQTGSPFESYANIASRITTPPTQTSGYPYPYVQPAPTTTTT